MFPVSTGETVVESGLADCSLTASVLLLAVLVMDMLSLMDMFDMLFLVTSGGGTMFKGKSVRSSAALLALSLTWQPLLTCHCSSILRTHL